MLSGDGTIAYDIGARNLDAHKTSAARQESTTRNLQLQDLILEYHTVLLILQPSHVSRLKFIT